MMVGILDLGGVICDETGDELLGGGLMLGWTDEGRKAGFLAGVDRPGRGGGMPDDIAD